jgi:hypothetical protein
MMMGSDWKRRCGNMPERMAQASILAWVKEKRPPTKVAYRFTRDIPEFMLPDGGTAGPFHKGDLVSADVLQHEVWQVLLARGAVERYVVRPSWPGGDRR